MENLYTNSKLKFNLYKRNTTIIFTSDMEVLTILKDLKKLGYDYVTIEDKVSIIDLLDNELELSNILKKFGCSHLLNKEKDNITMEERAILNIVTEIIKDKEIIIFNDVLTYIKDEIKEKIIKYLKREKKLFINITSNEEEFIINDYIIVLGNKLVALEGPCSSVMKEEKILKRLGFSLPFHIDLSLQLKSYGLIDDIFLTDEELVGELWKKKK